MRKQLFYLTNNQLTAYSWVNGELMAPQEFANDKGGWEAFTRHIASSQNVPAYLLVDLIEEAFQRDTIPHVYGKARSTLIKRRLGQLYRDTPYRQGSIQGREKQGRKDDQVLFSALTNAALPKPWADAILAQSVPLAGIFSLALLSSQLFKNLRMEPAPLLLVTHQSSGLRQSYFQDGTLRFSRLVPLSETDPDAFADILTVEIGKTRQFLASTRQLPAGAQIQIVILTNDDNLPALALACQDSATVMYRLISLPDAAHMLGLKHLSNVVVCDALFLSLLAKKPPSSHYQLLDQSRFYQLWQTRIAVYALSAAIVVAGVGWTGVTAVNALTTQQKNRQMSAEIISAEGRYQSAIDTMPATVAKPQNMKASVDIEQMIAQNAPEPLALFAVVSAAVQQLPELKINQMRWQATEIEPAPAGAEAPPPPPPSPVEVAPAAALIGIPGKPFQILIIDGSVEPFQNDYRSALDSVKKLTAALASHPQLRVEVTQWPLDIRPVVKLDGQAGNEEELVTADFTIKLVWTP